VTVIPILLYHSISEDAEPWIARYSVPPTTFAHHLDLIADSGRTAMTISDLRAAMRGLAPLPLRPIAITFDDGFADFLDAATMLAARRLPSTLYVTTGALRGGGPRPPEMALPPAPMLDWSQLTELREFNVEIGAHSHTHRQLDTMRTATVTEEIRQSKDLLEQACGHAIPTFAYPHGFQSGRIRKVIAAAGHTSACAVMNAFSSDSDNAFSLARLTVGATTTPEQMAGWLAERGARVAPYRERLLTTMWRWYRRAGGPLSRRAVVGTQTAGSDGNVGRT
jgi:peptidoglycan/xylan/chitin deacetylase (PgdA/CDA1 family)